MYGFDDLSKRAGEIEAALRQMDPVRVDAAQVAGISQILRQLT